ncbi:MAG TPA: glycosyltransferase [Candidatus Methylomirabilis sp.]|nr:glycosyltransferase [Candidatus Methylomirabilis sp.]
MVGDTRPVPLVSIILPTYNGERYLAESIASCLGQTHPNLELVVVDDGSSADIRDIVEAARDERVRYLCHPENQGLPAALNTGFAASRGDYLTWTSDDNRYRPQAIARMVEHLESHPEVGLVYAGCRLIDERGETGGIAPSGPPETIWCRNCVGSCFLYRRQVFERVGEYDPTVLLVEDYDYWVRVARNFRLERLDDILYDLRLHPSRLTSTLSLDRKRESHLKVLAKMRQNGLGAPVPLSVLRRSRAGMHIVYGRDYFFGGQTRSARRDLLAAIRLEPSNLWRGAVVVPLLKSLAGDRLLHTVRASRRRREPRPSPRGNLRLVHCCGQFAARQGGTERQARAVCGALAARGHQVSVLTREVPEGAQAVPGVTVHARLRAVDWGRLFGLTYTASAIIELVREAGQADILHAHHLYFDAVAARIAGRLRGRPVVAKMVGAGPGGDLDRLQKTAGGSFLLRVLRTLDAVIVPSPSCRAELVAAGFPAEHIRVIANGVDTALFRPDPALDSASPLGTLEKPMVVYTGRLIEAKGLRELLDAWPLVLREVPYAHLVLVGSGPLEGEIRQRAGSPPLAGWVHLTGEVEDVRPYLRTAAAYAFPSWAEGLPNALLEAMAMGLPCVATDIGPIRDAVTDGEEALLVPVRTPDRLAVALTAVLTQPGLAARLGHAARKRVEIEFSLEAQLERLESLYYELAPARRRGSENG